MRGSRGIELPAEAGRNRQLGGRLPLVVSVQKKLPLAIGWKDDGQVAAHGAGDVDHETRKVVGKSSGIFPAVQRCLARAEIEKSARAERLGLQEVVPNADEVPAPLNRMVSVYLIPVADHIEIRFTPNPRKAS